MRFRLRENATLVGSAGAGLALFSYLTLVGRTWPDYNGEARPAVDALVGGHVTRFLHLAPAYGGSLLLRGPFVVVAHLAGGNEAWLYRASTLPGMVCSAILGVWLARSLSRRGLRLAAAVALLLCTLNPMGIEAVRMGHPEELLGAVLCVGAVLAAREGRPALTGLLLGMAIANKEWALLALGPALVMLPGRRVRTLVWTVAVAGAITTPFLLAGAGGLSHGLSATPLSTGRLFTRWQAWWFLGSPGRLFGHTNAALVIAYRAAPGWLRGLTHPLIVALGLALTLLYGLRCRRRRERRSPDGLALLAFLLLLRCVLDPWDISYYSLPFLLALLVWEAVRHERPPVISLVATLVSWFVFLETAEPGLGLSVDSQALIFLAAAAPAAIALALFLYVPGRQGRFSRGRYLLHANPSA